MPTLTVIEAGRSLFWNTNSGVTGSGIGDGATLISQSDWEWYNIAAHSPKFSTQGVFAGYKSELQPTVGGGSSAVAVATGAGICYGHPFYLDGTLKITLTPPGFGSSGGLIILHSDWVTQKTRVAIYQNDDGNTAIPNIATLQNPGTQYAIPLGRYTITSGGVVTVTDTRTKIGWYSVTSTPITPFSCSDLAGCSINNLGDVISTGAATGDLLVWNGTNWVLQGGGSTVSPTANITCAAVAQGSGLITVNGLSSTPGTGGSTIINYAWEVYDSNNILLDTFSGAPTDPIVGSTYFDSGTYESFALDMTPAGSDTYHIELVVIDDNLASSTNAAVCYAVIDLTSVIKNGFFESGVGVNWWASNGILSANTTDPQQGLISAQMVGSGALAQVLQSGVNLTPGNGYTLSFYARADTLQNVTVEILLHASPFTIYYSQVVSLTTTWAFYTYPFTATNPLVTDNLRFRFFGLNVGTIYGFDSVQII